MKTDTLLNSTLRDLWADLQQPDIIWQLATVAFCLAAAWLLERGVDASVSWKAQETTTFGATKRSFVFAWNVRGVLRSRPPRAPLSLQHQQRYAAVQGQFLDNVQDRLWSKDSTSSTAVSDGAYIRRRFEKKNVGLGR